MSEVETPQLGSAPIPIDGGRAFALAFEITCEEGVGKALSLSSTLPGVRAVFFNPDAVISSAHLIAAADYAVTCFRLGRNLARSLHVEAFLFAAATREISKALELFRPDASGWRAVVVLVAERADACLEGAAALRERAKARLSPLGRNERAARFLAEKLGIGEKEIRATYAEDFVAAVEKCLLSRMALEFLSR